MAGSIKYISQSNDNDTITVTVEYNTGDAVPIIWQEALSYNKCFFNGFTSALQFHQEVILPEAAKKIVSRRQMKVASDALVTPIASATVYTVPGT